MAVFSGLEDMDELAQEKKKQQEMQCVVLIQ